MGKNRLEAFSDGVLAIIITIMVLEIKIPLKKMYQSQERKGIASMVIYSLSIVFAFFNTAISGVLFFVVAAMWIVPDRNIERVLEGEY